VTRLGLWRIHRLITRARRQEILRRRARERAEVPLGQYGSVAWRGRLGDTVPGGGTLTHDAKESPR
jgi:hypothetical protein